uniref:Uncharacterized protein n=1 Tax=Chenopodium quinoa TaxID=63459 RepID=A0A803M5B6_CHEQI
MRGVGGPLLCIGDLLCDENYEQLNKALAGTDHSWTGLTLKLCTALDTAKKLIESTNSNVTMLSENVGELEKMIKKGDSAIAEVRSIHSSKAKGLLHPVRVNPDQNSLSISVDSEV